MLHCAPDERQQTDRVAFLPPRLTVLHIEVHEQLTNLPGLLFSSRHNKNKILTTAREVVTVLF